MSNVKISAEQAGLSIEVTVSTTGTSDDIAVVADSALRAVVAGLAVVRVPNGELFFDQDAQTLPQPTRLTGEEDLESTPTEKARAARY